MCSSPISCFHFDFVRGPLVHFVCSLRLFCRFSFLFVRSFVRSVYSCPVVRPHVLCVPRLTMAFCWSIKLMAYATGGWWVVWYPACGLGWFWGWSSFFLFLWFFVSSSSSCHSSLFAMSLQLCFLSYPLLVFSFPVSSIFIVPSFHHSVDSRC